MPKTETVYRTINIRVETHKKMRVFAAQTDENISLVTLIDKAVDLYIKESKKKGK